MFYVYKLWWDFYYAMVIICTEGKTFQSRSKFHLERWKYCNVAYMLMLGWIVLSCKYHRDTWLPVPSVRLQGQWQESRARVCHHQSIRFRWLCTIGPTMEWLSTIVEVCHHQSIHSRSIFHSEPFSTGSIGSQLCTLKLTNLTDGGLSYQYNQL